MVWIAFGSLRIPSAALREGKCGILNPVRSVEGQDYMQLAPAVNRKMGKAGDRRRKGGGLPSPGDRFGGVAKGGLKLRNTKRLNHFLLAAASRADTSSQLTTFQNAATYSARRFSYCK